MAHLSAIQAFVLGFCSSGYDFAIASSRPHLTMRTLQVAIGFAGNCAPCGLSPQTNGMPVIPYKTSGGHRPPLARYPYTISCITASFARFRMLFIFRTHDCGSLAFNFSVTPSVSAYCSTNRRKSSCACSSMSARWPPSVPAVSRL